MPPKIDPEVGCEIPEPGNWPVDPQEDVTIAEDRLWIDGCFDFFHHGHAGVMLQSRRLGTSLVVGLHSDEAILANKGPTVMSLKERVLAVEACRFSSKCVPHAPYVTSLPWISHYGCKYVTHGDDITSDASGEDCYRFVKKAGRMKIVPRTPGISTTDLVGRMLLCTKEHFIRSLVDTLRGREGAGGEGEKVERGQRMADRISEYAAAPDGVDSGIQIYSLNGDSSFMPMDYPPAFVIAGIHSDEVINHHKGLNYPIMNIFERGLCVVQCRYVHQVVFGAPYAPTKAYLESLPAVQSSPSHLRLPDAVYHGPTSYMPSTSSEDPYADAKASEIFVETPEHEFQDVNAAQIVQRILDRRGEYEERQRKKGVKGVGEGALRRREMEDEAVRERERREGKNGA
ncbi:choline phosphate cytidylyltransferase [Elasticomyces elasticus]|nr:choline phosphate cytidylyltransferase [Elasticomyces elasticus]